ncbi:hypothetical protein VTN77DRAFT_7612 [Rasamsonia byssochlamydoides]|uniref:uncharacterized protein n=1 Tax=Rasamsonia byssochlamydoides TaxID=89139 RepID=UPI003743239F
MCQAHQALTGEYLISKERFNFIQDLSKSFATFRHDSFGKRIPALSWDLYEIMPLAHLPLGIRFQPAVAVLTQIHIDTVQTHVSFPKYPRAKGSTAQIAEAVSMFYGFTSDDLLFGEDCRQVVHSGQVQAFGETPAAAVIEQIRSSFHILQEREDGPPPGFKINILGVVCTERVEPCLEWL